MKSTDVDPPEDALSRLEGLGQSDAVLRILDQIPLRVRVGQRIGRISRIVPQGPAQPLHTLARTCGGNIDVGVQIHTLPLTGAHHGRPCGVRGPHLPRIRAVGVGLQFQGAAESGQPRAALAVVARIDVVWHLGWQLSARPVDRVRPQRVVSVHSVQSNRLHGQVALPRVDGSADPGTAAEGLAETVRRIAESARGKAMAVRVLPPTTERPPLAQLEDPGRLPVGLLEDDLSVRSLDIDGREHHVVALGDAQTRRSSMLRQFARHFMDTHTDTEMMFSGDRSEGVLFDGLRPKRLPPGRAVLGWMPQRPDGPAHSDPLASMEARGSRSSRAGCPAVRLSRRSGPSGPRTSHARRPAGTRRTCRATPR